MKKIVSVSIVVVLLSLLTMLQVTDVAKANPFPIPWPSTPNQEKPNLTIKNPQNYTTYNDTSVPVDLAVVTPYSWDAIQWPNLHYVGELSSVDVYLDGNLSVHYTKHQVDFYSNGNVTTYYFNGEPESRVSNLSFLLNQTIQGTHTLNITALSYTYNVGQKYPGSTNRTILYGEEPVYQYPTVISDMVYFTVRQPEDQTNFLLNQTTLTAIAIAMIIAAVTSVSLVYLKRHKSNIDLVKEL